MFKTVCRLKLEQAPTEAIGHLFAAANEIVDDIAMVYTGAIVDNIDRDLSYGKTTGAWPSTEALRDSIDWRMSFADDADDYYYRPEPNETDIEVYLSRTERIHEFQITREVGSFGNIYAEVHEYGQVIFARNQPYMVFKINDRWIKTDRVDIPERPFLRPAMYDKSVAKRAVAVAAGTLRRRMKRFMK